MAEGALRLGERLVLVLGGALAAYILGKLWQRRRFLRVLRMARITPEDLKRRIDAGEEVVIVDLRHPLDLETAPYLIPGAMRLSPDDVEHRHSEIPRDRDIVLYCT